MTFKAGIIGAAGFAGAELCRLILDHPSIDLCAVTSDANSGAKLSDIYPSFIGKTDIAFKANKDVSFDECDLVFLAVPHTAAMRVVPDLLDSGKKVFDLSADFRLHDKDVYEKWYCAEHTAADLLDMAVFGLPEIYKEELKVLSKSTGSEKCVLVACAGCYPTASSLAAWPAVKAGLVDGASTVIVDAISGITGAGKSPNARNQFCFVNESAEAYSIASHRHTPEIEQILGLEGQIVFTPHLAPMNRGLLSTVYIPVSRDIKLPTLSELIETYECCYADSPFVSVLSEGIFPKTRSVVGTNNAQIGLAVDETTRMIVATCAIDNLGKGAAGQAVQCANIVLGLDESEGLGRWAMPV